MTDTPREVVAVDLMGEVMYENDRYAVYEAVFPATTENEDKVVYLDGYCIWNKKTLKSDQEFRAFIDARITATRWSEALDELDLEDQNREPAALPGSNAIHRH